MTKSPLDLNVKKENGKRKHIYHRLARREPYRFGVGK